MLESTSVGDPGSVKENLAPGRICPDCDEHIVEAKLIQSCCSPQSGSATRPSRSPSALYLLRSGGRLCRLLRLTERFRRHLPGGRGGEGIARSHVRRTRDWNSARNSQEWDGHR